MSINRHNPCAIHGFSASFLRALASRKMYITGAQHCPDNYGGYTAYQMSDGTMVTIDRLMRLAGGDAVVSAPEANAHLIAAAPDLLVSLRWAIGHLSILPIPCAVYGEEYDRARAAIAKAEGL